MINGISLIPVLANLFIGYHEKKWFQEFDNEKVLMYKGYVDDIFCMFGNEKDAGEKKRIFFNSLPFAIKI